MSPKTEGLVGTKPYNVKLEVWLQGIQRFILPNKTCMLVRQGLDVERRYQRYCYEGSKKQQLVDPLRMHCVSSEYKLSNQGPPVEKAALTVESKLDTAKNLWGGAEF